MFAPLVNKLLAALKGAKAPDFKPLKNPDIPDPGAAFIIPFTPLPNAEAPYDNAALFKASPHDPPVALEYKAEATGPPIPGAIMFPIIGTTIGAIFFTTLRIALNIFLKKNSGCPVKGLIEFKEFPTT